MEKITVKQALVTLEVQGVHSQVVCANRVKTVLDTFGLTIIYIFTCMKASISQLLLR